MSKCFTQSSDSYGSKVDLQHNKIFHLEDSMIMYGIYNFDILEQLIETVHRMHNTTSCRKNSSMVAVVSKDGVEHYVINSVLYLTTMPECLPYKKTQAAPKVLFAFQSCKCQAGWPAGVWPELPPIPDLMPNNRYAGQEQEQEFEYLEPVQRHVNMAPTPRNDQNAEPKAPLVVVPSKTGQSQKLKMPMSPLEGWKSWSEKVKVLLLYSAARLDSFSSTLQPYLGQGTHPTLV